MTRTASRVASAVIVTTLVLAACTTSPLTPTASPIQPSATPSPLTNEMTIAMANSSRLTIVDPSGLVTGVARREVARLDADSSVNAVPDQRLIEMAWRGGACDASILEVDGATTRLSLTLEKNEGAATPPGFECPAIGLNHGLELSLSEPVQQDAVSFTVLPRLMDVTE